MKLVYGISRWTNPSRSSARHIDNGEGYPLCGGNGRKAFSWEREEGEPTCRKCVNLANKQIKLTYGAEERRASEGQLQV